MESPSANDITDDDLSFIAQLDGINDSLSSDGSSVAPQTIPVINSNGQFSDRPNHWPRNNWKCRNIRTVKRSNKQLEALLLPTVINLNPRSVYMSESWEREQLTLDQVIKLDNYQADMEFCIILPRA